MSSKEGEGECQTQTSNISPPGGREGGWGTAAAAAASVQPLHWLVTHALLTKVKLTNPPKNHQLWATRRVHYRSLDIAGWVLLGSCISLVIILGGTTWHYRCLWLLIVLTEGDLLSLDIVVGHNPFLSLLVHFFCFDCLCNFVCSFTSVLAFFKTSCQPIYLIKMCLKVFPWLWFYSQLLGFSSLFCIFFVSRPREKHKKCSREFNRIMTPKMEWWWWGGLSNCLSGAFYEIPQRLGEIKDGKIFI